MLRLLDTVRLVRMLQPERPFSGTDGVARVPRLGDVGAVVDVLQGEVEFQVESVDASGRTLWLATFAASELALVDRST